MTARPHVVHLTTTDVSIDWLLAPQLRAFDRFGFDVTTVSSPGPHVDGIRRQGIRHVALDSLTRSMDPRSDLRAARDLARLLRRLRPDILHTHNPKPGVIGRMIGHRCGVPIVVNTVHGLYAQPTDRLRRRAVVYAAEALAMRHSDVELVQNIEDVAVLRRLSREPERIVHLGNGIDLERFRPTERTRRDGAELRRSLGISPDSVVVGMVGRLVWEKGYRSFFDAIDRLHSTDRDLSFVVAGPAEPSKPGAVDVSTIESMGRTGVRFLGRRDDVENVYSALDLFVLPSQREGVPRAAMEAGAMGVPVIATDVRGCRQVVEDGVTGTLVGVDRPDQLARAIAALADDVDTRRRFGRAGARRAALHFDQDRVIDLTIATYCTRLRLAGRPVPPAAVDVSDRYTDSISLVETDESNEAARSPAA